MSLYNQCLHQAFPTNVTPTGFNGTWGMSLPNYQMPSPIDALPATFRNATLDLMNRTQGHPALITSVLLGALSLASQDTDVELPFGRSPCQLFLIASAPSGARKSTVFSMVMQPIERLEAELTTLYQQSEKECIDQQPPTECVKSTPAAARQIKLLYEDATPPALLAEMHEHWPFVCVASDEAGDVLNDLVLAKPDVFNKMWDGRQTRVSRRTSSSYSLYARMNLLLLLQPSELKRGLDKKGRRAHENGFWARCLFAEIADLPYSSYTPRFLLNNGGGLSAFQDRIAELLRQRVQTVAPDKHNRLCLKLTPEAQQRWLQIADEVNRCSQFGGLSAFPEYAAKLPNNIGRVAALFSLLEQGQADICAEYVERSAAMCEWYAQQFVQYFSPEPELPPHLALANGVLVWLNKYALQLNTRRLVKRSVQQRITPIELRNGELLHAALETLIAHRRVTVYKIDTEYIELFSSMPLTACEAGYW